MSEDLSLDEEQPHHQNIDLTFTHTSSSSSLTPRTPRTPTSFDSTSPLSYPLSSPSGGIGDRENDKEERKKKKKERKKRALTPTYGEALSPKGSPKGRVSSPPPKDSPKTPYGLAPQKRVSISPPLGHISSPRESPKLSPKAVVSPPKLNFKKPPRASQPEPLLQRRRSATQIPDSQTEHSLTSFEPSSRSFDEGKKKKKRLSMFHKMGDSDGPLFSINFNSTSSSPPNGFSPPPTSHASSSSSSSSFARSFSPSLSSSSSSSAYSERPHNVEKEEKEEKKDEKEEKPKRRPISSALRSRRQSLQGTPTITGGSSGPSLGFADVLQMDQKLLKCRMHMAREIYETESNYITTLDGFYSNFAEPIIDSKFFSKSENNLLFGMYPSLKKLHENLFEKLSAMIEQWSAGSMIGEIFCVWLPGLSLYEKMAENHKKRAELVTNACNDPEFAKLIKPLKVGQMYIGKTLTIFSLTSFSFLFSLSPFFFSFLFSV